MQDFYVLLMIVGIVICVLPYVLLMYLFKRRHKRDDRRDEKEK